MNQFCDASARLWIYKRDINDRHVSWDWGIDGVVEGRVVIIFPLDHTKTFPYYLLRHPLLNRTQHKNTTFYLAFLYTSNNDYYQNN